jgi:hypothetical protein
MPPIIYGLAALRIPQHNVQTPSHTCDGRPNVPGFVSLGVLSVVLCEGVHWVLMPYEDGD